eukprot:scaffold143_cov260-Pinguiococcus_pyrenoidosus.AAC.40
MKSVEGRPDSIRSPATAKAATDHGADAFAAFAAASQLLSSTFGGFSERFQGTPPCHNPLKRSTSLIPSW